MVERTLNDRVVFPFHVHYDSTQKVAELTSNIVVVIRVP
jgi:hypothetical protein